MELGKSNKEDKEEVGSTQKGKKKSTKNGLLPNGNECLHLGGPYLSNHVF
jgi:hypothetical protein